MRIQDWCSCLLIYTSLEELQMIKSLITILISIAWFVPSGVLGDYPLEPDPNAVGISKKLTESPGYFISVGATIFPNDEKNYHGESVAVSDNPSIGRARDYYDVKFDPNWDQTQFLSVPGMVSGYQNPGFNPISLDVHSGDEILYIDLAIFYDDNETNMHGGFWANWHVAVKGMKWISSHIVEFGDTIFSTMLRGPFWSGEKLEVGDTEGNRYRPQVMHFRNLGIWDWSWGDWDQVAITIWEGDGGWFDDIIGTYTLYKSEAYTPIAISDEGHTIDAKMTSDYHFKRITLNDSGLGPEGYPRMQYKEDGHDVDLRFINNTIKNDKNPKNDFTSIHVLGPEFVKGGNTTYTFDWEQGPTAGGTVLKYIDNISYIPGWDCGELLDGYDIDDDFSFSFSTGNDGGSVITSHGGCGDKTSIFFRANKIGLPDEVVVRHPDPIISFINNNETELITMVGMPGYDGYLFTELLTYQTNDDDDFGFSIFKNVVTIAGVKFYNASISTFDGNSASYIEVRTTLLEWPESMLMSGAVANLNHLATDHGFSHSVIDIPVTVPNNPYFILSEILKYDPDTDDDVPWCLSFDTTSVGFVRFQLATIGKHGFTSGFGSGAEIHATGTVIQFPWSGYLSESYVDKTNQGYENGSATNPWNSVLEGIEAVLPNGSVYIKSNSYRENVTVAKPCTLFKWGNDGSVIIGE